MLELQKLQAEVAKLQSEANSENAKAQLDSVKARQAGSQADSLDLDFLETQTGLKHNREMAKQGAQAEANMRLKDHEALLKDRNTALKAMLTPRASSK
jgi:hypothetical protein